MSGLALGSKNDLDGQCGAMTVVWFHRGMTLFWEGGPPTTKDIICIAQLMSFGFGKMKQRNMDGVKKSCKIHNDHVFFQKLLLEGPQFSKLALYS